jgi:hypothetical protein
MAFALLVLTPLAPTGANARVMMLDPGEELQTGDKPPPSPLDTIRIAVADGDRSKLATLAKRKAPFQVVAPSDSPDLVWTPTSHDVSTGSLVVAFDVKAANLAPVIDRTAVLHELEKKAAARRQAIKLASGDKLYREGDQVIVVADDVAGRALFIIALYGEGQAELLYPQSSNSPIVRESSFRIDFKLSPPPPPFGVTVFIAITAAKPINALEEGMKQADYVMSATDFLALIAQTLPTDARIGLLTVATAAKKSP